MSLPVIIHPCFQECQNFTLDEFWQGVFFNCACNKFPKGVRYDSSNRTIFLRTAGTAGKTKVEVVDLPEKPDEAYFTMMKIFKEKLGIFSSYDLKIRKEEMELIQSQKRIDMDCEWKKLKPRSIKEQLIVDYVSRLRCDYELDLKESKKLLSKIQLGFNLKKLTSADVNYLDRKIQSINGVEFNPETREWTITNEAKKVSKTEKPLPSQKFNQALNKFARDYKNRKLKL